MDVQVAPPSTVFTTVGLPMMVPLPYTTDAFTIESAQIPRGRGSGNSTVRQVKPLSVVANITVESTIEPIQPLAGVANAMQRMWPIGESIVCHVEPPSTER